MNTGTGGVVAKIGVESRERHVGVRQLTSPVTALRQHTLFPESIFESLSTASIGAYAVNVEQRILFWNRSAQNILGYSPDQVLGRRCYEVLVGITAGSLTPECQDGCPSIRCLQAGQIPGTLRLRMLCASGARKSVSLTPMVIGGGRNDAPLLVHLFSDGSESDGFDQAAESVRYELTRSGYDIVSDRSTTGAAQSDIPSLTPRELEVLRLVALGNQVSDISDELHISHHTVRNHIRNFRGKLGAASRLEAVVDALRLGILQLD